MIDVLDLYLHGQLIGAIINDENDRNIVTLNADYIADPMRPTLSQSFILKDGSVRTNIRETQRRLSPYFANALPEGVLREKIAERGSVSSDRDFPLLWLTGGDLPGALEARPRVGGLPRPENDRRLSGTVQADTLRFSLAGMQIKFSALRHSEYQLTIPAEGRGGKWIVKLPDPRYPGVSAIEFSMMTLAKELGFAVPQIGLIEQRNIENLPAGLPPGDAFFIKRFDRNDDGTRVHAEDFAQVFGLYPTSDEKYHKASYLNIAEVVLALQGREGVDEFVRRLVFNFLIGNADMHVKNWSLIYRDGITPELAPPYDYVSTIIYIPDNTIGLSLVSGINTWGELSHDAFDAFARRLGLPSKSLRSTIADITERTVRGWQEIAPQLKVSTEQLATVNDHMLRLPIVSGIAPKRPRGIGRARPTT